MMRCRGGRAERRPAAQGAAIKQLSGMRRLHPERKTKAVCAHLTYTRRVREEKRGTDTSRQHQDTGRPDDGVLAKRNRKPVNALKNTQCGLSQRK